MNLSTWKPKERDVFQDFFNLDNPFYPLATSSAAGGLLHGRNEWYPSVDITEDEKMIFVKADLPGFRKEDIDVSIEGTVLTLRGERTHEDKQKGKKYHRVERISGAFQRRIDLGTQVDVQKIQAKYRDGVLELEVPKAESSINKRITIS